MEFTWILHFFYLLVVVNSELVPLYMWGNRGVSKKVPALQKIDQEAFQEDFSEKLHDKDLAIVVFVEQSLSPEDFGLKDSSGNTPFKYLSEVEKFSKTSYMLNVENPLKTIQNIDNDVVEVSIQELSENIQVDNIEFRVLIIDLDDMKKEEKRYDMFQRHDKFIASIYEYLLKTRKAVVSIYTGLRPSWEHSVKIHSRKTRSITSTSNQLFANGTIYFYTSGDATITSDDSSPKNVSITYSATRNNDSDVIVLEGEGNVSNTILQITFQFSVTKSGYWLLNDTNVVYNNSAFNVTSKNNVEAPVTFSYACGTEIFQNRTTNFSIKFPRFQVQPIYKSTYLTNAQKFDDSYNCIGFTTIPIWSGIFVTFMLIIIMSIGLTMIMDIKTMDRFDDAKGKTITINVSE